MEPHDEHSRSGEVTPRFGPPTTANLWWRGVMISGALFCVSCFLWITAGFAEPQAPGNRWLNQYGLLLVASTGAAAIASAVMAMWTDQRQTRRMEVPRSTNEIIETD